MNSSDTPKTLVSGLISASIDKLAPFKNQRQLAKEMGFIRPNMLSMIRTGAAQVPFGRIPDIAAVLGIDPALLLKCCVIETWPEFDSIIHEIFGGVLTENERDWIRFFADVGMVVPPRSLERRQRLVDILQAEEWVEEGEEEGE